MAFHSVCSICDNQQLSEDSNLCNIHACILCNVYPISVLNQIIELGLSIPCDLHHQKVCVNCEERGHKKCFRHLCVTCFQQTDLCKNHQCGFYNSCNNTKELDAYCSFCSCPICYPTGKGPLCVNHQCLYCDNKIIPGLPTCPNHTCPTCNTLGEGTYCKNHECICCSKAATKDTNYCDEHGCSICLSTPLSHLTNPCQLHRCKHLGCSNYSIESLDYCVTHQCLLCKEYIGQSYTIINDKYICKTRCICNYSGCIYLKTQGRQVCSTHICPTCSSDMKVKGDYCTPSFCVSDPIELVIFD